MGAQYGTLWRRTPVGLGVPLNEGADHLAPEGGNRVGLRVVGETDVEPLYPEFVQAREPFEQFRA